MYSFCRSAPLHLVNHGGAGLGTVNRHDDTLRLLDRYAGPPDASGNVYGGGSGMRKIPKNARGTAARQLLFFCFFFVFV
jgi:hypothetical protein